MCEAGRESSGRLLTPAVEPHTVDRKLAPVKVAGGDGEPLAPLDGRQPPAGGYRPRGP